MYNTPHPLLTHLPLTISPFITLPTPPTLPYTYAPLPSTLPPPFTPPSPSPAHITATCRALLTHIQTQSQDATRQIRDWEAGVRESELAEKRRVAPGWLDREEKILEPERGKGDSLVESGVGDAAGDGVVESGVEDAAGDELDRAFGGMGVRDR